MDSYPSSPSNGPLPTNLAEKLATPSQLDFEIEFYGGILERDPGYVEVLRVMGTNLTSKGDYQRGLEIDRRLTKLCPNDRVAHYNLACSYSVLGLIDLAFKSLERALECGYDEFDYLHEDQDIEPLRKDPRFVPLIESYRQARDK